MSTLAELRTKAATLEPLMARMLFRGSDIAENGKFKEAYQFLEEENEEGCTWSEQFDIWAFNQTVIAPHGAFFPW